MNSKKTLIIFFLSVDFALLELGFLNFRLLAIKAGLPNEYKTEINNFSFDLKHISKSEKIIEFDGRKIERSGLVDFYLLNYKINDTVKIKSVNAEGKTILRTIALPTKYTLIELLVMAVVAMFFLFTGIYVLLRYRGSSFSYIIHMLSISTGLMVIFDWGDLFTYGKYLNFVIFLFFEIGIYLVPVLFLHLSFTYPVKSKGKSVYFLVPFYATTVTFIIIAFIHLFKIIFMGINVAGLYYINFHTTIADIYLVIVLILTIAKFEHSALTLTDVIYKKQIYWALLGITFGPLIYVFLCLVPRILLGSELVSLAFMQFTIIIAPIMLLISLAHNKSYS